MYRGRARPCQTPLPAEMTLGTCSSCANTAALLSTHSRSGRAKSNYLPCLEFFFFLPFRFISVAHIQRMSCAARPKQADKRSSVAFCSLIFLRCVSAEFLLPFSHSFSPKLCHDGGYPFCPKGEPPKTRRRCGPLRLHGHKRRAKNGLLSGGLSWCEQKHPSCYVTFNDLLGFRSS